ncbi:MAG: leucine-rich repeat protein, partial [Acutalibacteraceae bacterium]
MKQNKFLKRIIACIMVFILTLTTAPLSVFAAATKKIVKSGSCGVKGDSVKYTLYDDGTLVISGQGKMKDFAFSQADGIVVPYANNSYSEKYGLVDKTVKNVIIKNGITRIGNEAFAYFIGLKNVSIPKSITSIGDRAFLCCIGLKQITIPNSVKNIGENAFGSCTGLTSVTIPNSVKSMSYAFQECTNLASVTIESGVTNIGNGTFSECTGLTSITIPNSVKSIGNHAFDECSGLKSVIIDNGVTSIGKYAFYECTGLKKIIIPDSVKSIGENAFYKCTGLTSVAIGSGVKSIGKNAFYRCTNLISIAIGSGVTSIGEEFDGCTGLKRIAIPDSVKSIDEGAFYNCEKLKDVYYYGTKEQWENIRGIADNYVLLETNIHYEHAHTYKTTINPASTTKDSQKVTACSVCGAVSKATTIYRVSSIKLSTTSYTYNGKPHKPTVTVKNSAGKTLKNGTDYTVKYSSGRKNPGVYTVTVTFKGNYSGTKNLSFTIAPKAPSLKVTAGSKKASLSWNKQTGASGYAV